MANSSPAPVYVFIGTKAQYIKTAPLLRLMQQRGMDYFLIDSGQHAAFAPKLRKELGIKEPDAVLSSKGNIKSVVEAALWFARYVLLAIFRPKTVSDRFFPNGKGICIIHGDTPSTLLALILAKRVGMKIAHIEAGLRSFNVLKPFPEELVRIISMRFSDLLFAPSEWAMNNMRRMKVRGKMINLDQNTNVEALYYSLDRLHGAAAEEGPYCLMTMHRVETILSKKRLSYVVALAEQIAQGLKVVFVLHDPTKRKLEEWNLISRITENSGIRSTGLVDHGEFLSLVSGAEYVITDGGSIQEECYYLDVPCLVMRSETEREEGLGTNVRLSNFDETQIGEFLSSYSNLRRGRRIENKEPSETILSEIVPDVAAGAINPDHTPSHPGA